MHNHSKLETAKKNLEGVADFKFDDFVDVRRNLVTRVETQHRARHHFAVHIQGEVIGVGATRRPIDLGDDAIQPRLQGWYIIYVE